MAVLEPALAILDETDSGLDIDALRIVAGGVNRLRSPAARDDRRHPLPAAAQLHRPRLRARAGGRPHRPLRRQGDGARARGEGLRLAREGARGRGGRPRAERDERGHGRAGRAALELRALRGGPRRERPRAGCARAAPRPRALCRDGAAQPARRGLATHAARRRSSARASSRPSVSRRPEPSALARVPARRPRSEPRSSSSTGASRPSCPGSSPTPGSEVSSLRELLRAQPARIEPWLGRALGERGGAFCRPQHRLRRGRGRRAASRPAPSSSSRSTWCTSPPRRPRRRSPTCARSWSRVAAASRVSSRASPAPTAAAISSTRSPRSCSTRAPGSTTTSCSARATAGSTSRRSRPRSGATPRLLDHALSLGAALSRNDIDVVFAGEGGECTLDGLFVVDGERISDTHSRDRPRRARTARAASSTRASSTGRRAASSTAWSIVRPGAQKTDAVQTNKNLLLSREALVHSTPQLEIRANDVKCRARLHDRAARRHGPLLPALARHRRGGGAQPADLGLRERRARGRRGRRRAPGGGAASCRPGCRASASWRRRSRERARARHGRRARGLGRRRPCGASSRSCARASTASRSSTSTPPPAPRSRRP